MNLIDTSTHYKTKSNVQFGINLKGNSYDLILISIEEVKKSGYTPNQKAWLLERYRQHLKPKGTIELVTEQGEYLGNVIHNSETYGLGFEEAGGAPEGANPERMAKGLPKEGDLDGQGGKG